MSACERLQWWTSTAERSYPTSEVRGRSRKDPMPEGQQSRGATPGLRSGAAAESARLRQGRNGREELLQVGGQGWRLGGATPCLRPGLAAGRSDPRSKEWWLQVCKMA